MGKTAGASREAFTSSKIRELRRRLRKTLKDEKCAIVIGGSYARCEASRESDLDFYVICDSIAVRQSVIKQLDSIRRQLEAVVPKPPSPDGAFAQVETIDQMASNIGGDKDSNDKITRRLLFLLEGEWLYGKERFERYREKIVSRYIRETISEYQISRFLLNDLIRYYRTICVDFEYKTSELNKTWGLRHLKLLFSRKLLYFSGILVVAESAQLTPKQKRSKTLELLALTPIERIRTVCGTRADAAVAMYEEFLTAVSDPATRKMVEGVSSDRGAHPDEFRALKNKGHRFTWELLKLLRETYLPSHLIHAALVV